jgi:hypothetical protein
VLNLVQSSVLTWKIQGLELDLDRLLVELDKILTWSNLFDLVNFLVTQLTSQT